MPHGLCGVGPDPLNSASIAARSVRRDALAEHALFEHRHSTRSTGTERAKFFKATYGPLKYARKLAPDVTISVTIRVSENEDIARQAGADTVLITRDESSPRGGGFGRVGTHAGGLEGGITTGQPLVCRAAMKPISTLMTPLGTVDLRTGQAAEAVRERSDVCAVPAAGVVAEAMVAIVLAGAVLEKFGGDSMRELRRNFDAYCEQIRVRGAFPGS